jgi:hypothetical protein
MIFLFSSLLYGPYSLTVAAFRMIAHIDLSLALCDSYFRNITWGIN